MRNDRGRSRSNARLRATCEAISERAILPIPFRRELPEIASTLAVLVLEAFID
jgi:hypothetical protein